jgi:signal transduction histidine kinase
MVSGFLFLTVLILILAIVSLYILDRANKVALIHSRISQLQVFTLTLIKSDNDFFDLDVYNVNYFKTRTSTALELRDSMNKRIQAEIRAVRQQTRNKAYEVDINLDAIDSTLSVYNDKFVALEALVYRKGFKDDGMEGKMRWHAHKLEEESAGPSLVNVLFLRRHEKDFFLRHDTVYRNTFNRAAVRVMRDMARFDSDSTGARTHMLEYQRLFNELVNIQSQIGLSSKDGLRRELNELTSALSNQYFLLSEYSLRQSVQAQQNARLFYIAMLTGAVFFSLISGLWISRRLSEPIARLSSLVRMSIVHKKPGPIDFNVRHAANEINALTAAFNILMHQTNAQLKEIQSKSKLLKRKNRQLKQLNRELDNFLYSTAHDLRSPLTSLLGLINIMRYDNRQENLVVYFDMMEKSIQRSDAFIAQIVSFSKNKRLLIKPERLDLYQLVEEVFEGHSFPAGNGRLTRETVIEEVAPFYSDRNRVTILLNNLISNAIRYSDPGKEQSYIKLFLTVNELEATVEVRDNGIGIGPEHIDKIFDMFYRASTDSKGSGLGLFVFHETLKRLKGQVRVTSTPGEGSSFFIILPNYYKTLEVPTASVTEKKALYEAS